MKPWVALRALRELIADPEKTEKVFEVIQAMSGNSMERGLRRFKSTTSGARLLAQGTDLMSVLVDKQRLRSMPVGSLGQAYLDFLETGNLDAQGLIAASEEPGGKPKFQDADIEYFAIRSRDQHDLWHVVSGYGRDVLGEAALLGFTYAQTRNRGIGIITFFGALKLTQQYGSGALRAVWQGYRAGFRCAWLPSQEWELLLEQPLHLVRRDLGITPPDVYQKVLGAGLPA